MKNEKDIVVSLIEMFDAKNSIEHTFSQLGLHPVLSVETTVGKFNLLFNVIVDFLDLDSGEDLEDLDWYTTLTDISISAESRANKLLQMRRKIEK